MITLVAFSSLLAQRFHQTEQLSPLVLADNQCLSQGFRKRRSGSGWTVNWRKAAAALSLLGSYQENINVQFDCLASIANLSMCNRKFW